MAAIDQAVVVEPHEHLAHRARECGAERVRGARPVRARADEAELLEDRTPRHVGEPAHAFDERLAPQVVARLSLGRELLLDDVLRRDARVVRARHPERVVARHAAPAHEHVLHRVVEAMSHVQDGRHVGRRHHEHVRRATAAAPGGLRGIRAKHARPLPFLIEGVLCSARVVLRGEFGLLVGGRHCLPKVSRPVYGWATSVGLPSHLVLRSGTRSAPVKLR